MVKDGVIPKDFSIKLVNLKEIIFIISVKTRTCCEDFHSLFIVSEWVVVDEEIRL